MQRVTESNARSRKAFTLESLLAFRDWFDAVPVRPAYLGLLLCALIIFYLGLTAAQASRYLWHDELYTYYIAKSPSLIALWQNIRLDLNPPLIFLAERFSLKAFGDNLYSARIPSILGFLVGSLCFGKFVANRLRPAYGILAVLVFWATPFEYFATEARPYGLVIGFFGLAMLAWQKAIQPNRSASSVMLLGFTVFGMMCSHVLGLIYIVPFALVELLRWYRARHFDWALWAALVLPSVLLVIYIPLMSRYQEGAFPAVTQASPAKLIGFFYRMLEPESLCFLLALCFGLLAGSRKRRVSDDTTPSLPPLEWAFTWALILIPVLVTAAMMRSHGVAFPRYSGPAVFLFGILFAFLLALFTHSSRSAAAAAGCVLLLYLLGSNAGTALGAMRAFRTRNLPRPPLPIAAVRPDLPLVAASGINFLELDRYADPATVSRLHYLTDREYAIRYAHATIFEGMPNLIGKFPIRATIEPYREFVADHPYFLVLGQMNYPEDWLLRRLADIHASLQYLGDYSGSQLYLVTMPGHGAPAIAQ